MPQKARTLATQLNIGAFKYSTISSVHLCILALRNQFGHVLP